MHIQYMHQVRDRPAGTMRIDLVGRQALDGVLGHGLTKINTPGKDTKHMLHTHTYLSILPTGVEHKCFESYPGHGLSFFQGAIKLCLRRPLNREREDHAS